MSLCSNFKGKYFVSSILNAPSIKLLTSSVCCVLVGQVVYSIRDTIKKTFSNKVTEDSEISRPGHPNSGLNYALQSSETLLMTFFQLTTTAARQLYWITQSFDLLLEFSFKNATYSRVGYIIQSNIEIKTYDTKVTRKWNLNNLRLLSKTLKTLQTFRECFHMSLYHWWIFYSVDFFFNFSTIAVYVVQHAWNHAIIHLIICIIY